MKKRVLAVGLLFLLCFCGCNENRAVFSWEIITDTSALKSNGISTIYQHISSEVDTADVLEALKGYTVYYLIGESEADTPYLLSAVEQGADFQGIMLDYEPYLRKDWEENKQQYLIEYIQQVKILSEAADNELWITLPRWYDEVGLDTQLEQLIASVKTGICLLDYYRGSEAEFAATEIALCEKYGKQIVIAYELTPADGEGITEKNSYYDLGIQAVVDNYELNFIDNTSGLAFHDYTYLQELTK